MNECKPLVVGGFFMGSCVSYLFWKYHLSAGDLWLENITSAAAGRGSDSSTFRLNVSAFYGTRGVGGVFREYL